MLRLRVSGRVWSFVALAAMLAAANTYGSTLAAALFLSRAGADSIPIYYVLSAGLSIPVSIAFSRIVDRWQRVTLFAGLLVGGAVLTLAAAPAANSDTLALFYALYIVIGVFEQLSYSVFYVMMADYFTAVETNRSTTVLAVGMAVGGLVGGGLASIGAGFFSTATLLFGMPLLLVLTLGLVLWVRSRVAPLGEAEPQEEESLLESLASFGPLLTRYPIVALLALGVFINIVVQSLIEYQVFVIYTESFPDEQALTSFMGTLSGVLNVINILTSIVLTGPLLARLGVARMNLVYPVMTVSAFLSLAAGFSLPAAVFSNTVYDPWAHSVDGPVFVSNYNAVPHRFVGRVRIFNDGLMYPLAMAITGAVLWLVQDDVSQGAVTFVGLILALGFLACGLAIRRAYASGLMEMLRTGSLDLDTTDGAVVGPVPPTYYGDIRRLLESSDQRSQGLGLELVARADARVFMNDIENLLGRAAGPVRSAFVRRFAGRLNPDLAATIARLLMSEEAAVRASAAEALVASDYPFDREGLTELIKDPAREVSGIGAIEAHRRGIAIPGGDQAITALITGAERLRLRALQVIRRCDDPKLVPLMARMREGASSTVLSAILEAAAELGSRAPSETVTWAKEALTTGLSPAESALRRAAYRLLAARGQTEALPMVAIGLGDAMKDVRSACAAGLASFGEDAFEEVRQALESGDDLRETAAIEAAGRIGGLTANDMLYRNLAGRHFSAVRRNTKWLRMLPKDDTGWDALALALSDSNRRALDTALATLGALGYRRTLQALRGVLAGGDARSRASAVETIASIGHRRFVQPLLPMLEDGTDFTVLRRGTGSATDLAAILSSALEDDSRWVRAGALLATQGTERTQALSALAGDEDPVVQNACAFLRDPTLTREPIMNRLMFLKSVPLFDGLSLDDLLSVDNALGQEQYMAGEVVVRQGDTGASLFLVAEGTASIRIGGKAKDAADGKEVATLKEGDFFGEMSLFDDQPRSATVVSLTDATLLTLERDRFSTLVLQRPEVLLHICKMFGNRLREANRKLIAA